MRRDAGTVLEGLNRLFHRGTVAGLSEGGLLDRFVSEADEAAFSALMSRHGPMVLGVCRRALRDEHDVEDAFQATFLVFVRRAGSIRDGELVGHWLHGVAHRVAVRARANAARRSVRERPGVEVDRAEESTPPTDDLATILDEELARLPEQLRAPLILCYLEGLTHDEAAQRLGWPVGTVRSRMARARGVLQHRLTRRGIVGAVFSTTLAPAPVSASLLDATVRAALGLATHKAIVISLAQGVLNAMILSKLKLLAVAALVGLVALGGVQTFARQDAAKPAPVAAKPADPKASSDSDNVKFQGYRMELELAGLRAKEEQLKAALALAQASLADATAKREVLEKKLVELSRPAKPEAAPKAKGPIPEITKWGDFIIATAPGGDRVAVYNTKTSKAKSVRFSESKDAHLKVDFIMGPQYLSPRISGPKVGRIAVFDFANNAWYAQDLREPVTDANPQSSNNTVVYALGRNIYTFNLSLKKWDVFELPEGAKPTFMGGGLLSSIWNDGHIYTYSARTGKWDDLKLSTGVKPNIVFGGMRTCSFELDGHVYTYMDQTGKWTDFDTRTILDEIAK